MRYNFDSENHIHTLDGRPLFGTSTVVGVLNTPLAWWASGLAVQQFGVPDYKIFGRIKKGEAIESEIANLELSANAKLKEIQKMSIEDYLKLLGKAYRAHDEEKKDKAESGTDLHALLERFVKSEMGKKKELDAEFEEVEEYVVWSRKNVKKYLASEAHCYSEKLWTGGITDAIAEMIDGSLAVIDFKSAKAVYPKHILQEAGYALQIEENGMFSENGKANKQIDRPFSALITVPFGAEKLSEAITINTNVIEMKKGFDAAVFLYQLLGINKH